MSVSKVLQLFKGRSARELLKHLDRWRNFFSKNGQRQPHLWSPGKFYRSVGNVSAEIIEKYIKYSHKKEWDFHYRKKGQQQLTTY